MSKTISFPKKCYSCNQQFNARMDLFFDPSNLKTYCYKHTKPGFKELSIEYALHSIADYHTKEVGELLVKRLLGKSMSFRPNTAQVYYLMQFAEKYQTDSFNATMSAILDTMMLLKPIDDKVLFNPFIPRTGYYKPEPEDLPSTPTPIPKEKEKEKEEVKNEEPFRL